MFNQIDPKEWVPDWKDKVSNFKMGRKEKLIIFFWNSVVNKVSVLATLSLVIYTLLPNENLAPKIKVLNLHNLLDGVTVQMDTS